MMERQLSDNQHQQQNNLKLREIDERFNITCMRFVFVACLGPSSSPEG
jgi:hypothetical protein